MTENNFHSWEPRPHPRHKRDLLIAFAVGFAVASILFTIAIAIVSAAAHSYQCSIH